MKTYWLGGPKSGVEKPGHSDEMSLLEQDGIRGQEMKIEGCWNASCLPSLTSRGYMNRMRDLCNL